MLSATVAKKSTTTITASASDNVAVQKVEFYVNNFLQCPADTSSPYTCSWKVPSAPRKTYSIQAKAYDTTGNSAYSQIVTVKTN